MTLWEAVTQGYLKSKTLGHMNIITDGKTYAPFAVWAPLVDGEHVVAIITESGITARTATTEERAVLYAVEDSRK